MALAFEIEAFLTQMDHDFHPPLSARVSLRDYAEKICRNAIIFSAHDKGQMTAFAAFYCNAPDRRTAYITMVAVASACRNHGLGACLLDTGIRHARKLGFKILRLEVHGANVAAIAMYTLRGFVKVDEGEQSLFMEKILA
jgi:ribosomal protein S18 acetylase RimI-like enzyme